MTNSATTSPNATPPPVRHSKPAALKVGFVLAERFTLSAFAGFIDVLRLSADEGDRSRPIGCSWAVLGRPGEPIKASCGVTVMPDRSLTTPEDFDYVVVVGGLLHGGQDLIPGTLTFLQEAARAGVPLVGLCTGSFVLARAGLLEGHVVCVSWFHREEFAVTYPRLQIISNRKYVIDRQRITSAGGTSVVHLAAELVERHRGHAVAAKSLRILIEDQQVSSRTFQPEPVITHQPSDHLVQQAMLQLEDSLRTPIAIADVAASLHLSTRQLERRFLADVGMTPREYRTRLRLARAAWLLTHTDLSITEIGGDCGFSDSSHFSRLFLSYHNMRPTQKRQEARLSTTF
ncbi:GlxA family transcriptional regulator [Delftia lacustris]